MVQLAFNAANYEPTTGGQDVFETGEYMFHITNSTTKPTKKGDGVRLVFTATCLEEGQSGKKVEISLNVQNPNQETVDIAMRELSAISHCVGRIQWNDTQELHGIPFRIRLEKTSYTDKNGVEKPTNDVKAFMDAQGNPPGQGGTSATTAPTAAPGAPAAPGAQQPAAAPAAAPTAAPGAPAAPGAQQPVAAPAAAPGAPAAPGASEQNAVQSVQPVQPAPGAPTPPWPQS